MGQYYYQCEAEVKTMQLVKVGMFYKHKGFYKIVITEEVFEKVSSMREPYHFVKKCVFNYSMS